MAPNNQQQQAQQQARQQARRAVRQATASGQAVTRQQTQALRQAGVNPSNIQNLLSANRAAVSTAQQAATQQQDATAARQAMDPTVASAMQTQANQGLKIGQQFYDSPEFQQALGTTGLTPQQVAQYAMSQGYGLGDQFQQQYGTTVGQRLNIKDAKNLAQALRIAGARGRNDLVNRKELKQLTSQFDKTGLQILGRLDQLNENTAGKGRNPIGVKSNTYNQIFGGKFGGIQGMDQYDRYMGKYQGPLAQNLFAMGDTRRSGGKSAPSTLIPGTGKMPRGFGVYGRYNDQPIFAQGTGKSWADTRFGQPQTTTYTPFYTPPEGDGGGEIAPPIEPKEPETPDATQSGAGADLASFAPGFRTAKGRRAKAGKGAQGYASMQIAPSYAAGVGSNYG